MSRQEAQTGSATSEYSTVPELAKTVRRNRKTVYGWIATGEIGEAAGPFVVQGRFLFHWSTFWAKQFKPREEPRWINPGQLGRGAIARFGAAKVSPNQAHPDPTPTDQKLSGEA
jgi:hypothetical protein